MPERWLPRARVVACLASLLLSLSLVACPSSQRAGSAAGAAAQVGKSKGKAGAKGEAAPQVQLKRVQVDKAKPSQRRFGALTLLAAYELTTEHPRFGGLSGLSFSADGKRLLMVSDRGRWFSAALEQDQDSGLLRKLSGWRGGRLLRSDGAAVRGGKQIDAESIVVHHGVIDVGFEQRHRVLRYARGLKQAPTPLWMPPQLAKAPRNGGLEAMTALPDGRLLAICEKYEDDADALRGWIIDPAKKRAEALSLIPSDDFKPTDLATLPGGDVLLLERAHSMLGGTRARFRRIAAASLKAGAKLVPKELARFDRRHRIDNFEGLAVQHHGKSGKLLIYVISDDNFSRLQRTLLYQFAMSPQAGR
jgi:hypothetical protein